MTNEPVNIPDLAKQIMEHRTKDRALAVKPAGIRISEVGHSCTRYLVHAVLDWDQRKPVDAGLSLIFGEGREQEDIIVRDLLDIRAKFWGQQDTVSWDQFGLVGHPDGKLYLDDAKTKFAVVEIKSTNEWTFSKLDKPTDFIDCSDLTRKWFSQLQLYMLLLNTEYGLFLMKERTWGKLKQINVTLDYALAESILKKAQTAWRHIQAKTYPERLNDLPTCSKCPFAQVCMPDLNAREKQVIASDEVAELLDRLAELEGAASDYDAVQKQLKKLLPDVEGEMVCGHWQISGKKINVKTNPKPASEFSYIRRKYDRLPDELFKPLGEVA